MYRKRMFIVLCIFFSLPTPMNNLWKYCCIEHLKNISISKGIKWYWRECYIHRVWNWRERASLKEKHLEDCGESYTRGRSESVGKDCKSRNQMKKCLKQKEDKVHKVFEVQNVGLLHMKKESDLFCVAL